MDFLTSQERADLKTIHGSRFDLVGQTDLHAQWEERRWETLRQRFAEYPVQWANSSDRLYQLPYDDDFLTALSKERARKEQENQGENGTQKKRLSQEPWTYQEGMIFEARLMKKTPKAMLVRVRRFGTFWVPLSQIDFEDGVAWGHIWLPEWLMKDKGLTSAQALPELNPPFEWEPALLPNFGKGVGDEKHD